MNTMHGEAPRTIERAFPRVAEFPRVVLGLAAVVLPGVALLAAAAVGVALRTWQLDTVGFNSDEAVYAGQAAAIAGVPELRDIFPIFRAHPLLFQYVLAIGELFGADELGARLISVAVGMLTVGFGFLLGRLLYGTRVGVFAALFMALMPYHVVVTRQVLLDGPMTLFATLALYLVAKFADTGRPAFLYAAGASLGLTFLAKETGIILLGGVYVFLALSPEIRVRLRDLALSIIVMLLVIAPFPLSLSLAGGDGTSKAGSYLIWQLFRRANHDWIFYPETVPVALGFGVVLAGILGLFLMRRWIAWQEKLLITWVVVPIVFFQLWPVKGFQYLLPLCVPFAVLAAFAICEVFPLTVWKGLSRPWLRNQALPLLLGVVLASSLALASWYRVQAAVSGEFLAGSGGVPGGREAGTWVRDNVPVGATLMTIGPSMANIIQFYGHRPAFGLSVSPNPLHRNPSYEPINNPDLEIRSGELQYIVWDSFSASRSTFFGTRITEYAERYHGRVVHTESITVRTESGGEASIPIIVIYEVRP